MMQLTVTDEEFHTILAALRYYQQNGQGAPHRRSDMIHDIATNGGEVVSLDYDDIENLCQRINVEDPIYEWAAKIEQALDEYEKKTKFRPEPGFLLHSLIAVVKAGQVRLCPTCYGKGKNRSGSCPTCDGARVVKTPVFDLDDPIGGWDCCPFCFEGQNDGNNPCPFCKFWMDKLDIHPIIPEKEEP